jgi:hypothetical protein
VRLEVLGRALVAADLHDAQLIPLPNYSLSAMHLHVCCAVLCCFRHGVDVDVLSRLVDRTKEMWTPILRWFEEQSRHR